MVRSPVLFLIFNRPDTTSRVFDAIRAAQPPRLYIAADGPRPERNGEARLCEETRKIVALVDWPCEVKSKFHESNVGCRNAVSSAITWFFENEPEGIILEDDCLPHPSFFPYCDELLARYRDEPKVMTLSGNNFQRSRWLPEDSYYFSRYTHIWGWASWRRAWQHYDVSISSWPSFKEHGLLHRVFPESWKSRVRWSRILDDVARGKIDTWDYQWSYSCWEHGGLTVLPRENLVTNIGFGDDATHTKSVEGWLAVMEAAGIEFPLRHPAQIQRSFEPDEFTEKTLFGVSLRSVARESLKRMIGAS